METDKYSQARARRAPSSLANLIQIVTTGGFPKKTVRLPKTKPHPAPTPLVRMRSRSWSIFRSTSNNSKSANPATRSVQAEMLDQENSACLTPFEAGSLMFVPCILEGIHTSQRDLHNPRFGLGTPLGRVLPVGAVTAVLDSPAGVMQKAVACCIPTLYGAQYRQITVHQTRSKHEYLGTPSSARDVDCGTDPDLRYLLDSSDQINVPSRKSTSSSRLIHPTLADTPALGGYFAQWGSELRRPPRGQAKSSVMALIRPSSVPRSLWMCSLIHPWVTSHGASSIFGIRFVVVPLLI
ncbi:hypothetical protein FB45DRAFT_869316 [Roridomyces roridus]|uniref:Uncharacterized protein n=1 Tax=Roridomyces roridus TaxID=1738132 RepID=A0AAD7BLJ2_9AGAR|nr:hypothetical protein FB45DRAFT_869316 [Roridomyces roridus]